MDITSAHVSFPRNEQNTLNRTIPSLFHPESSYFHTWSGHSARSRRLIKATIRTPAVPLEQWPETTLPNNPSYEPAASRGLQDRPYPLGPFRPSEVPSTGRGIPTIPSFIPPPGDDIPLDQRGNGHVACLCHRCEAIGDGGSSRIGDDARQLVDPSPHPIEENVARIPRPNRYPDWGSRTRNTEPEFLPSGGSPTSSRVEDHDQDRPPEFLGFHNNNNHQQVRSQETDCVSADLQESRAAPTEARTTVLVATEGTSAAPIRHDFSHGERSTNRRTRAADTFVGVTQRSSGQLWTEDALETGMILSQLGIESEPLAWWNINALSPRMKLVITATVLGIVLIGAFVKLYQAIHSLPSTH